MCRYRFGVRFMELHLWDLALHDYAWRCLRALGIDTDDGVIRASMVHYNNLDDIDKIIRAFEISNILKN